MAIRNILFSIFFAATACKPSTMNDQNLYWTSTVVSAEGYPSEVHTGFLATKTTFLAALPKTGTLYNGWDTFGTPDMSGGHGVPSHMGLTWVSYAEKKFWKVDAVLDSERIGKLLSDGYPSYNVYRDTIVPYRFKYITIAVAPGGVVAVFLAAKGRRIAVGRYQAKEVSVDVNAFYNNPHNRTQQEFFDWHYSHLVDASMQDNIKRYGIPYDWWTHTIWKKYNWRFKVQFYQDDYEPYRECSYINGEVDEILGDDLEKHELRPPPSTAALVFKKARRWADIAFDTAEVIDAFRTVTKGKPENTPVEIFANVVFMYKGVDLIVQCEDQSVLLTRAKVDMYARKNTKKEDDEEDAKYNVPRVP